MIGRKKSTFSFLFLFLLIGSQGIAQLAIGQWRDHLSYKKGIAITQSNTEVFCATESGIFSIAKEDYSIERLSKITGLSDVGVNTVRYNDYNQTLLIGYKNANIDLVAGKNIYNIPDIKRSIITGKKNINNIHFREHLAYLACGFGIVVLDMNNREIKDTYYIGINGGYINVRDVTSDDNNLYAASDSGVYWASLASPNLADFNSWKKFTGIPKGIYNSIVVLNGKVYVNYSGFLVSNSYHADTLFAFDGTAWSKPISPSFNDNSPVKKIELFNNELVIAFAYSVDFFDINAAWTGKRIGSFLSGYEMEPMQAIVDNNDATATWMADHVNGAVKNNNIWGGTPFFRPNGPNESEVYSMKVNDEDLWVALGNRSGTWSNTYKYAEVYKFSEESWSNITRKEISALDTLRDIVAIAVDPANKDHIFCGNLGNGVIEIKNGQIVKIWDDSNSSLQSTGWSTTFRWIAVFGLAYDEEGNLWVSNSTAPHPLSVYKKDGTWQAFNFSSLITNPTAGNVLIDKSNRKWMILPRQNGLIVFDNNGTWATGDDKMKKLTFSEGNGAIPGGDVSCIVEDKEGEIWVGTDKGIGVFFCADQIFTSAGCDAQPIYIQQDGHTQLLLATEVVTTIAVDGANRKWIGTQNSGVFLMSADGTQQIQHFTVDNSPLLSNEISSIAIHPKTGEVFFGTSNGIISYRNDATEGLENFTNVYVFPNPIEPGYEGPIAITGLVENATVKITDVSGALVYNTKALGGQAIWYGKNFKGERVKSGVYMVFCSNDDGTQTFVTKLLLVN